AAHTTPTTRPSTHAAVQGTTRVDRIVPPGVTSLPHRQALRVHYKLARGEVHGQISPRGSGEANHALPAAGGLRPRVHAGRWDEDLRLVRWDPRGVRGTSRDVHPDLDRRGDRV